MAGNLWLNCCAWQPLQVSCGTLPLTCHDSCETTCLGCTEHRCILEIFKKFPFCCQVTSVNLGGYLIAFGGVCWYNYKKLQAMKARQAAQTAAQKADLEEKPVTERTPLNGKA